MVNDGLISVFLGDYHGFAPGADAGVDPTA